MISNETRKVCAVALEPLRAAVKEALKKLGGNFYCGAYSGPCVETFFREFRTEFKEMPAGGSRFWPTLQHDAARNIYILEVPKCRLRAHGEYKKISYLLRAHAEFRVRDFVDDAADRNSLGWEFSDEIRFGEFLRFGYHLSHFKSFEQLHDYDIPLSQILGFISRHYTGSSLLSLYGLTPQPNRGHDNYNLVVHRSMGRRRPHYEQMAWAHQNGLHDISSPTPQHLVVDEESGNQTILLTDSVWSDADGTGEGRAPLVSITRTVVWSNNRRSRHGFRHMSDDGQEFARSIH